MNSVTNCDQVNGTFLAICVPSPIIKEALIYTSDGKPFGAFHLSQIHSFHMIFSFPLNTAHAVRSDFIFSFTFGSISMLKTETQHISYICCRQMNFAISLYILKANVNWLMAG